MAKVRASLERIRDPSVQTAISEAAYAHVRPVLKEALVNCPYALTDAEADCLENFGITVNPYATQTHTHAACKAIENRLLEIVGKHLPKERCTMLFLKRSKLRYLRRAAALKDDFINQDVEPKDLFRYDRDTIRTRLKDINTPIAYMSDTLHFMSHSELIHIFADSPKLQTMLATVVLPIEAVHRRSALYPALYSINYGPKGFEYIPGNHGGGAYFHPYDTLDWLKVRQLQGKDYYGIDTDLTLTFQLVESLGANHLFIIQRGDLRTPLMRTFCRNALVTMPKIFCPESMNANRPLTKTKAMQMLMYCKSVKQVSERDIYAKFRQIISTQELELYEPDEIVHLCNYFNFVAHLDSITCYEDLLGNSLWRRLTIPIRTTITKALDFFRGQQSFSKLLGALKWESFSYSLEPIDFTVRYHSASARLLSSKTGLAVPAAAAIIKDSRSDPTLFSEEDLEEAPFEDFLGRLSFPPNAPRNDPTSTDDSDGSPDTPDDPPVEPSPAGPAPANEASTSSTSSGPPVHHSDWQSATILHMLTNLPFLQLKGRRAYFFATHPVIDYGHDRVLYSTLAWPSTLTDIVSSLHILTNACLVQVYEEGASIPWHRDNERCYEFDPITTLNFGKATFEFEGGVALKLDEGDWFSMAGPLLHLRHRVTAHSPMRISLTFRLHKHNMLGVPLPDGLTLPFTPAPEEPTTPHSNDGTSSGANDTTATKPDPPPTSFRSPIHPDPAADLTKQPVTPLPWASWVPLLQNHGFDGQQMQHDPAGNLIIPVQDIHRLAHCAYPDEVPECLRHTLNTIKRHPVEITIDHQRASSYASDIKNCRTGKLLAQMDMKWKASFAYKMQHESKTVTGTVIHGCGGSGKSHAIQTWMRTLPADQTIVTVITPTVLLRNDWSTKLPILPSDVFKTFEKAIVQPCNPVVIFDDYTKLPPGSIEATVMHHSNISYIVLTGDSRQSVYHELNAEAYIATLPEAVDVFTPFCEFYLNATHRNVQSLANKLGVYSERQGRLKINFASHHLKASRTPLLVPSTMKRNAMADMGHHSMTYAGCQGLTAPKIQILLDSHTQFCSDRVLYTCLSRAVDSIHFINTGPTTGDYWAKLESTPYLKAFIDTYRDEKTELYNSEPASDQPREPEAPTTHFPLAPKPLLEPLVSTLPTKEEREIFSRSTGYSDTIQTEDPEVQLFQHQQARDETLYWATIDARLSLATPEENLQEFNMKKDVGDILFMNYAKVMNLPAEPVEFEERLWEVSAAEVRNVYLSKPVGNLINAAARQSPDFPKHKIALFLKSQWVKKVEKLGALKVKPGQTIASFMQETVMLYGTMARYLRKMRQRFQPPNIFINCERTPEDLDTFVKTQWNFARPAHTNDFTAFDQSQDGAMLQFEVMKAKFFNVPSEIIEGYIYIKLNAAIFLGTLGIMRLSGEGPTFDANTECSIAYNATRFHIDSGTAQVYAGDDMALDRICPEKSSFHRLERQLKLTSKPMFPKQVKGDYAEFCGWVITPAGIIKHSLKMYASIQLQKKLNNIKESARSYALDLRYAYKLGDSLQDHLTEEEAAYHQQSVRDMHLLHQSETLAHGPSSPPHHFATTEPIRTKTQKRNATKRKQKVRLADIAPPAY
ncbi:RNA dependent RNA polymerase [Asparagus virus 3]|uniref:RNA replication protein n=1 Tax=Asparagus virus 3 TaxID=445435 RepID=B1B3N8_9VIRU|nr:RNA dependent RNA polymerase [Asparagus virus 3]BAG12158.1 RNA dependent RNA polymerase [Asparagus virus 3]